MADVAHAAYRSSTCPRAWNPAWRPPAPSTRSASPSPTGWWPCWPRSSPDTGQVDLQRIVYGHDCGTILNPAIVEGQIEGGVAQGIGTALYEAVPYDADGQPRVALMLDYPLPLAPDMPPIEQLHTETPTPLALNGAKGVGESGTIATPAAIVNAVQAALGAGVPTIHSVPIRPEWILDALDALETH